jgi:hypothetical protein
MSSRSRSGNSRRNRRSGKTEEEEGQQLPHEQCQVTHRLHCFDVPHPPPERSAPPEARPMSNRSRVTWRRSSVRR